MIQAQAQLKFPSALAKNLRAKILSPSKDPLRATRDRFVWDLFYVPHQYHHWRSSLIEHWDGAEAAQALQALGNIARERFGCQNISQPWVSLYQDGHYQRLHTDPKHGPYAFVLSLTPRSASFLGGETAIAQESLVYGISDATKPFEHRNHFKRYHSRIGDLLVFDGALPHEVLPVTGTKGLEDARLSLHGWFTSPEVMMQGRATNKRLQKDLESYVQEFGSCLEEIGARSGYVCIEINRKRTAVLSSTLRSQNFSLLSEKRISACFPRQSIQGFGDWIRIPLQL
jgi:hypothetical protein